MNNKLILSVAVIALCSPFTVFSQNETTKGLSGNGLTTLSTVVNEPSVFSENKKTCLALAVGVPGPFRDNSFSTLSFPDDDCRAFFESIDKLFRYQYDIKKYSLSDIDNASRTYSAAIDLLDSFSNQRVSDGDVVFIYFSGHGVTNRENYYFPFRDSQAKSHALMLSGSQIYEVAETLANRGANVFIFLDTCASGSIYNAAIDLKGPGGVVCFPAASKSLTTQERLAIGSSEYGNMLNSVLSGNLMPGDEDVLTVSHLIDRLSSAMKQIKPRVYNSPRSKVNDAILVSNLKAIRAYNKTVDQYKAYIEAGDNALHNKQYDKALKQFDNATKLSVVQNQIHPADRIDISKSLSELNNQIASAIKRSSSDNIWATLANIDVKSPSVDKSKISISKLMLGCGRYYKNIGDLENAYIYFLQAYNQGDKTDAPYELYSVTANNDVPAIKPLANSSRQKYLEIAAQNGNKTAYNTLHPAPASSVVPVSRKKTSLLGRIWEDITYDDPVLGVSLISDFHYYPIGLKGDFMWGPFHIGLDASAGSDLFSSTAYYGITQTLVLGYAEKEFIGSEDEQTYGTFGLTITPGIFYKRVSLDCGLGIIGSKYSRTDIYMYKSSSSSTTIDGTSGTSTTISSTSEGTIREIVESKGSYFVFKPGLTGIIGDTDEIAFIVSANYRICPKQKELNGFELSLGIVIPLM